MRTNRFWLLLLAAMLLCSCALGTQIKKTRFNLQHPAGPTFGGYVVDIASKNYTAKLMCSFADGPRGKVLDVNAKDAAAPVGVCDEESMTIDIGITGPVTLSLSLGGMPLIDKATKHPKFVDLGGAEACLGCKQAEFDFSFSGWPR